MSILTSFKKFAMRGNMVDLAIGFTVGAAFTTVISSLVTDVIMPPIGLLTGNANFSDLFWVLDSGAAGIPEGGYLTLEAAQKAGAVTLNYGAFLNSCLALLIVAMAMFAIIRTFHRVDEELDEAFGDTPPEQEPTEKKCDYCRTRIPYRASRCPACTSELEIPDEVAKDSSLAGS